MGEFWSRGARVVSIQWAKPVMDSRVRAWKEASTSVCLMIVYTLAFRSALKARRRSMVTSLSPRAGLLAMRSRFTSSFGFTKLFR